MAKPISGGEIRPPMSAVRIPAAHVHSSRWNAWELHEAAIVRTIPGPANIASSVAVCPDCTSANHQSTIVNSAASARSIHLVR
jgi:formate dehydrogenase maturation protein FdhE